MRLTIDLVIGKDTNLNFSKLFWVCLAAIIYTRIFAAKPTDSPDQSAPTHRVSSKTSKVGDAAGVFAQAWLSL